MVYSFVGSFVLLCVVFQWLFDYWFDRFERVDVAVAKEAKEAEALALMLGHGATGSKGGSSGGGGAAAAGHGGAGHGGGGSKGGLGAAGPTARVHEFKPEETHVTSPAHSRTKNTVGARSDN